MGIPLFSHTYFMKEALKEAERAFEREEIPVGAVIVCNDIIVARAHNLTETLNDVTAHAEMQAFTAAASNLGGKYLSECTLYVSLEPCVMCAGAAFWTRIGKMVWGASDKKRGFSQVSEVILHPRTQIVSGIMENECSMILKEFFLRKR
jgi:tRNA(adenine34) deaminase